MSRHKTILTDFPVGYQFGERTIIGIRETRYDNKVYGHQCSCSCGNISWVQEHQILRGAQRRCLSCANRAKNTGPQNKRPGWKGGRSVTDSGYVRLTTPEGRDVYEHRLVMEKQLNRQLLKHETVHHKNGIRNDNRIENLELWSTSQPYGQRVEDKLAWALEFLAQYLPESLAQGKG